MLSIFAGKRSLSGRSKRLSALVSILIGQLLIGCAEDGVSSPATPIDPDDEIIVTSPSSGESYTIGGGLPVRWILKGRGFEEINSVTLEISPFEGSGWAKMIERSIAREDGEKWGHYTWTIPDSVFIDGQALSLANRSAVRLKIMQYATGDTNKIAYSRNVFSIKAK